MTNFWWIRHAPVIKSNNCCYGSNEVECDLSDLKSFKNLASILPNNSDVYTSKLSRALNTLGEAVKNGFSYNNHIIDDRLIEQNLGDYTGMTYNDLYSLMKSIKAFDENWLMCPAHVPPNGESFLNLSQRVRSFINEILLKGTNKNVVIFSHGGPIRAAISYIFNYNKNNIIPIEVENTKITLISYNKNQIGKLIFLNK